MARAQSTELHKQMLNPFTSAFKILSICTTVPTTLNEAWKIKGTGFALARSSSAGQVICQAPATTTNGWTVATCSLNSITVSTSGSAQHVCIMSGSSTGAMWFCTPCTTRNLTTSDTVSVPSFNIRIADPAAS